jgi:hypothetical protein
MKKKEQSEDSNVGRGKVEIQNQDFHFSTAQLSLRRKEKGRLHKTIDAPFAMRGAEHIVIASFGDGFPRGIQSILLQSDTTP